MPWFILKEGCGKHMEGSKVILPGVPFKSSVDLCKTFPDKFTAYVSNVEPIENVEPLVEDDGMESLENETDDEDDETDDEDNEPNDGDYESKGLDSETDEETTEPEKTEVVKSKITRRWSKRK